jgi:hypothetical protein
MFEGKLIIFQEKDSVMCGEIFSEGARQKLEVDSSRTSVYVELQRKTV